MLFCCCNSYAKELVETNNFGLDSQEQSQFSTSVYGVCHNSSKIPDLALDTVILIYPLCSSCSLMIETKPKRQSKTRFGQVNDIGTSLSISPLNWNILRHQKDFLPIFIRHFFKDKNLILYNGVWDRMGHFPSSETYPIPAIMGRTHVSIKSQNLNWYFQWL